MGSQRSQLQTRSVPPNSSEATFFTTYFEAMCQTKMVQRKLLLELPFCNFQSVPVKRPVRQPVGENVFILLPFFVLFFWRSRFQHVFMSSFRPAFATFWRYA